MAIAYLLGKASAKLLNVKINIPLILVLSVLPDIDLLFNFIFNISIHRGPTHSVVTAILVFVPFFVLYRRKAVPYFAALVSHSLIADFFIGGRLQLLWPLSTRVFGFTSIDIYSSVNVILEFTLFAISVVVMLKTRDLFQFFRNRKLNLVLAIPIFTVLLPTFSGYPLSVPLLLVLPHLFYLVVFAISVVIALKGFWHNLRV
jgi:hypothetical protein